MGIFDYDKKPTHEATFGERIMGESTAVKKAGFGDMFSGASEEVREATFGDRVLGLSTARHDASLGDDLSGDAETWRWK